MPNISIRLRLTLLYSAILALTLLLFGGVLYAAVERAMLDTARSALVAEAKSLDVGRLHQASRDPSASPDNIIPPGTYIQIRAITGKVLLTPPTPGGSLLPLSTSALARLQRDGTLGPDLVSIAGQRALLYSYVTPFTTGNYGPGPGSAPGGNQGPTSGARNQGPPPGGNNQGPTSGAGPYQTQLVIQVAHALAGEDSTLGVLRAVLVGGGLIATLLAFGAGWLLAGTALRPIARLTRTARAIGEARDFGRRVAHSGDRDEVGRLASTFNAMLTGLQEAYQGLQEAYHVQRRFVGDASHELRTPLTSIRGNLGLLQRQPPIAESDRVAVLADLVSESERLSRLVADLLTLARSDAGRPLRRDPVALHALVAGVIRQLTTAHPGRVIGLEGPTEAAALADPDALTQVLVILLDNALKFTPPQGTVTVSVGVRGAQVALVVRDTGPGITPEAQPHIFERFYQGDAARTGSGAGLGLAIARALVEGQGGRIAVASVPGQGSAFTVTLPRAAVARQAVPVSMGAGA